MDASVSSDINRTRAHRDEAADDDDDDEDGDEAADDEDDDEDDEDGDEDTDDRRGDDDDVLVVVDTFVGLSRVAEGGDAVGGTMIRHHDDRHVACAQPPRDARRRRHRRPVGVPP